MQLKYVYNGQPVADGERVVFTDHGKMFVRTGLLGTDLVAGTITYRLREVIDASTGSAPVGGNFTATFKVPAP